MSEQSGDGKLDEIANDSDSNNSEKNEAMAQLLEVRNNAKLCIASGDKEGSLVCRENEVIILKRIFGSDSQEFRDACTKAGKLCNELGISCQNDIESGCASIRLFDQAFGFLEKAEIFHTHNERQLAVTYNNFACLLRSRYNHESKIATTKKMKHFRQRKHQMSTPNYFLERALEYLSMAEKIESSINNPLSPGDTHLNMCAILSLLGHHSEAVIHARQAVQLLQKEVSAYDYDDKTTGVDAELSEIEAVRGRVAVLCIACHNEGASLEHLRRYFEATAAYQRGIAIALERLGSQHPVTSTLKTSLKEVRIRKGSNVKSKTSNRGRGKKKMGKHAYLYYNRNRKKGKSQRYQKEKTKQKIQKTMDDDFVSKIEIDSLGIGNSKAGNQLRNARARWIEKNKYLAKHENFENMKARKQARLKIHIRPVEGQVSFSKQRHELELRYKSRNVIIPPTKLKAPQFPPALRFSSKTSNETTSKLDPDIRRRGQNRRSMRRQLDQMEYPIESEINNNPDSNFQKETKNSDDVSQSTEQSRSYAPMLSDSEFNDENISIDREHYFELLRRCGTSMRQPRINQKYTTHLPSRNTGDEFLTL